MVNPLIPSTSQEGVVGVEPWEPIRGYEEGRSQVKTRRKSKVVAIDALESHDSKLETSMSVAQDILESLEERVDGLEGEYIDFMVTTKAFIQNQANTLRGDFQAFYDELLKLRSFMQQELLAIRVKVNEVRSDWAGHKLTLTSNLASTSSSNVHRFDVLKLNTYDNAQYYCRG